MLQLNCTMSEINLSTETTKLLPVELVRKQEKHKKKEYLDYKKEIDGMVKNFRDAFLTEIEKDHSAFDLVIINFYNKVCMFPNSSTSIKLGVVQFNMAFSDDLKYFHLKVVENVHNNFYRFVSNNNLLDYINEKIFKTDSIFSDIVLHKKTLKITDKSSKLNGCVLEFELIGENTTANLTVTLEYKERSCTII